VDGCGFETLPLCLAQLSEQKELFEFATGLKAEEARCVKRARAERYYPVLEGRGTPEKTLRVSRAHSWRGTAYLHLLAQGVERVMQGEGGRSAGYFIDEVKFAPSGSTILRVFSYLAEGMQAPGLSELPLDMTAEECSAQKRYLEKLVLRSPHTPHASVFCSRGEDGGATLLLTALRPASGKDLSRSRAAIFASFSECLEGRAELLKRFPESGIAVVCRSEGGEGFSAYALLREL